MKPLTIQDPETHSPDLVAENIAQLQALFPEAFTEGQIDFDVLRQLLGDTVDEREEKYGLNWHGKRRARQLALTPSSGTLRPCPEDSLDWDTTQNLVIEGDNLEVLKLLQKSYAGKVKLIYIDPPYNTGKDFVYPDDYRDSIRNYRELTGQTKGGRKMTSNTEDSGRFHTDWLNMIYPRLKLAKACLRNDGLIIVSISDAETHNLRHCLDEIFGAGNFVGCVVWNSTKSVTNTALISVSHTYNLIYARNKDYFVQNRPHFRLPEQGTGFANPDNDPRGPWKADPFQVGGERPNQLYPVTNPNTGQVYRPNPGSSWKNELKVFEKLMADNRMVFGATGQAGPQRKRFLSEAKGRGRVTKTLWTDVDTTTNATRALKDMMGDDVFDNPKPVDLIRRFIQLGTHDPAGAVVMDFFAGSGTTAQAVLEQNLADGGSRRYLLVQLPEPLDPKGKEQKFAATYCAELGKPATISELTKERLRRAAKKIGDENPSFAGDLGFRVFQLDHSNIRAWEPDRDDLAGTLLANVDHLRPGRTEADILYELLLKLGLDLCVPIDTRTIAAKTVYSVGAGTLLACLDQSITRDQVEPLALGFVGWHADLAPAGESTVLFRDSAFADDVTKTNLTAILRQHGLTNVRSL
ncbi:site-specific DNA-methyltransferase [Chloroflexota bacterium]